jgi:ABC-2 type transport system permease protein
MTQNKKSKKWQATIQALTALAIVIFINIAANSRVGQKALYGAIDLTEEKRYTLTQGTRTMLGQLNEVVFVRVLLEGEFPAGFKRLQTATREVLDDFRAHSGYIEYEFVDPNLGTQEDVNAKREEMAKDGIIPVNLRVKTNDGTSTQLIYPYAIVYFGGRSIPVNILENEVPGVPSEVILNNAVALLEYKFARAIQKLQRGYKPIVAFTEGHGELMPQQTADLENTLRSFYEPGRLTLDSVVVVPEDIEALIVAKPRRPFSEKDKFKIDQFVMRGGKVLWLIDKIAVDLDSLQNRKEFYPSAYDLNIDDLLFRYGVRINEDLALDLTCTRIPLATGMVGNAPQFDMFKYPYHVLALPRSNHPVVKSLEGVNLYYPSTIDLNIETKQPLQKTPLLQSSEHARFQKLPIGMDFNFLRYELDPEKFPYKDLVYGALIEGQFSSMYENRMTRENLALLEQVGAPFLNQSEKSRMIVIADGDIAANPIRSDGSVLPLGTNIFEKYQFSNKDFLVNAMEYLLDETGIIEARGKDVRLRLLDETRAKQEKTSWQLFNIALPLVLLALAGFAYAFARRRKYAKQS